MNYIEKAKFWSENPCFDIETQKEAKNLLKDQNRDLCKDSFRQYSRIWYRRTSWHYGGGNKSGK